MDGRSGSGGGVDKGKEVPAATWATKGIAEAMAGPAGDVALAEALLMGGMVNEAWAGTLAAARAKGVMALVSGGGRGARRVKSRGSGVAEVMNLAEADDVGAKLWRWEEKGLWWQLERPGGWLWRQQ